MNLNISTKFNNNDNSRYKNNNNLRNNSAPSNLSFQGGFQKIINGPYDVTYMGITAIQEGVDKILGDGFFTTTIKKTGLDLSGDQITFKDKSFFEMFFSAVTYPFIKLPLDIANAVLTVIGKVPFLSDFAQNAKKLGPLAKRTAEAEQEKSYECAKALLDKLSADSCIYDAVRADDGSIISAYYDTEDALRVFSDKAATGIVDLAKNYSTRDERTLNRASTSTVSALYSARDFYNISMLQKDDHDEAKKAERGRLKQELTRMALSAATTFVSLGVFSKYTKGNVALNAIVIAFSALVAEVGSRLLSKTPLVPLSAERAKEISKKKEQLAQEEANSNTTATTQTPPKADTGISPNSQTNADTALNQENKNPALNFKGNNFSQRELFNDFLKNSKVSSTFDVLMNKNISKDEKDTPDKQNEKPKKKSHMKAIVFSLFSLTSALFLAKRGFGGEYGQKLAHRQLVADNETVMRKYIEGGVVELDEEITKAIKAAKEACDKTTISEYCDKFFDFVDYLKYKQVPITAKEIEERTRELQKLPEAKDLAILDDFVRQAKTIDSAVKAGDKEPISIYVKRELIGGVYSGIEKLVKTLYQIFSLPAEIFDIILNKVMFEKSEKLIDDIAKKQIGTSTPITTKVRKGLSQYVQLIFENQEEGKIFDTFTRKFRRTKTDAQIIDAIKTNTRNFEIGAETGTLANLSRTMVTIITSYFFINDYRNKVLIESHGEDIETANEEGRERVAHKASNFVINGALMNIFNSVFKRPLNGSLFGATAVATATELTNEFMVRKSICQPTKHMKSRQDIIDYEQKQESRDGLAGMWSRGFRKVTGKKSLSQKIESEKQENK